MNDYKYDLFISYSRKGTCRDWVLKMLKENLVQRLDDELPMPVTCFIDEELEPGINWQDRIRDSLLRSKVALCIWSPKYFQSEWCMAEWKSMEQRQQVANLSDHPCNEFPLVYPVLYSNGNYFPADASETQYSRLFLEDPDLTNHVDAFKESPKYADLTNRIRILAEQLALRIANAPPFEKGWPWIEPPPSPPPIIGRPRM